MELRERQGLVLGRDLRDPLVAAETHAHLRERNGSHLVHYAPPGLDVTRNAAFRIEQLVGQLEVIPFVKAPVRLDEGRDLRDRDAGSARGSAGRDESALPDEVYLAEPRDGSGAHAR